MPRRRPLSLWEMARVRAARPPLRLLVRVTFALLLALTALALPAASIDLAPPTGATLLFRSPRVAEAQGGPNRAGVVVRFGDGRVESRCVDFAEAQVSGLAVLQRSGLPVVAEQSPMGAGVC